MPSRQSPGDFFRGDGMRGAIPLIAIAFAVLLAGCGSSADTAPPTQDSQRGQDSRPRYDPVAEYEDEIWETLSACWSAEPNEPDIRVVVIATMLPDGTVMDAEASDPGRYRTDVSYRKAADRALRAVMNPRCQPLPFNAEDWPSWQTVSLVFTPGPNSGGN